MSSQFFDVSREQSAVKTAIVAKYFMAWAKVIIPTAKNNGDKIAYIDLFCGPGRYTDGTESTPVQILRSAAKHPDLSRMLLTIFNDVDQNNVHRLQTCIDEMPEVKNLRHKPDIMNHEVGTEIANAFDELNLVPTFFFVDPWGYKGLSLKLINSVLKNWGCDCIFFFNYNRINMGLSNSIVKEHMESLFGESRATQLREKLSQLRPEDRELTIVEELSKALKELGGKFVLPFRFRNEADSRTTHHLVFVSKHVLGYEIMKQIMAKESSSSNQGVASFEYSPATADQPFLSNFIRPLEGLGADLIQRFAGKSMPMKTIYEAHHVDTPFVEKNYKECLAGLEERGLITAQPPAAERPRRQGKTTFGPKVVVTFP
jgi:three-Cys-motif partner protein